MQSDKKRIIGFVFVVLGIVSVVLSIWYMVELSHRTGRFDSYIVSSMAEYFIIIIIEGVASIILGFSIMTNEEDKYSVRIIGMSAMFLGIGLFFLSSFGLGIACQAIGAILFVIGLIARK